LRVRQIFWPPGVTNASLHCWVENKGPNDAQNTKLTLRFDGSVALGSVAVSTGTFQVSGSVITCDLGSLAVHATNRVDIEFLQPPTNTVLATATASTVSLDLKPGDNASMLVISTPPANATGTVFSLAMPVVDMAADPIRGGIFLAIDRQMPDLGNGIMYFDPQTGELSPSTFVGADINRLAVSPDGQVLFASSAGKVCKLDANSLAVLSDFALLQSYSASDLKIFPDDLDRVAVLHQSGSFEGGPSVSGFTRVGPWSPARTQAGSSKSLRQAPIQA